MRVYGGSKPQTAATSPAFATHWGAEPPGWSRFALARSPRIYPAPYYHPAPHAGYSYAAVQHAMPVHIERDKEPERRPRVCEPFDLKALVDVDQSEFTLRCSEGLHLVRLRPPVSSLCRVPAKGHEAFEKMMP
ncbi:unnamed protein product [Lampetra fluviatilis]